MKARLLSVLVACGVTMLAAAVAGQVQLPLPAPGEGTPNFGRVVPQPEGARLSVPAGFTVSEYAGDLAGARIMLFASNGDLFVAQSGRNVVSILRDTTGDGAPDRRFVYAEGPTPTGRRGGGPAGPECVAPGATGGRQPFGLAFQGGYLYVGYTDCLVRYRYSPGDTAPQGAPERLADFPTGGHSTRNVIFNRAGTKMYVAVGSASNNDDGEDERRAAINEYNPDGTGHRVFASGIRNPVGLALQPGTDVIWTAVNERDNLGDDLVPDYATSVKDGAFYGWPYSYIGQHYDPKHQGKRPDLVQRATVPDVLIQAHSAALGITFYTATQFPARYRNGAFVALHGSWNRSRTAGVKVIFVPFTSGQPGAVEDFLTGFVVSDQDNSKWGRPVGVTVAPDGSLLVSDDGGNRIWRVQYAGGR
jgi:glucose/arabinose dehydrogenase